MQNWLRFAHMSDVTRILQQAEQGDPQAANQLLPLVYDELRKLAVHRMAHESPGHTLQPTALVHEAWIRLTGDENQKWEGRSHFFAAAAEAMRRILIEKARRKRAARHGGGQQRVDFLEADAVSEKDDDVLLAVNDALDKLAAVDSVKAELVKLRYFVGMTNLEAARALGVSEPTAKRYWTYARAWLYEEIENPSQ
jgi:RNA polymerase sigma factor (TIGR02999 family)